MKNLRKYKHKYLLNTDIENILRYLSKSQVMGLAELEHKKYAPKEILFK